MIVKKKVPSRIGTRVKLQNKADEKKLTTPEILIILKVKNYLKIHLRAFTKAI